MQARGALLLTLVWLLALPVAACGEVHASQADGAAADAHWETTNKLDLLFVLPTGVGSDPRRVDVASRLSSLLTALSTAAQPPDLHLGVVDANLGAGSYATSACGTFPGKAGRLESLAGTVECSVQFQNPAEHFVAFAPAPDGGAPAANFVGDLLAAFKCLVPYQDTGCSVEQFAGAARASLEGCNAAAGCVQQENTGFLRNDALLAVILVGDEDDCTLPAASTLFDPIQTSVDSQLGPLTTYRCFEFGVLCDGMDPGRSAGVRNNCVPGSKDPDPLHQLLPLADVALFLKTLKSDPRAVYVGIIGGAPTPISVTRPDASFSPLVTAASCAEDGDMRPGIRLASLAAEFDPDRGRFFGCDQELASIMSQIGADLAAMLGQ